MNNAKVWPEKHAQKMERKGIQWWVSNIPSADEMALFPGLRELTLDILTCCTCKALPSQTAAAAALM